MTTKGDLRRKFIDAYLITSKLRTRDIAAYVESIDAVVIDTPHITDGTLSLNTTWTLPGASTEPLDTAYRATIASMRPLMRGVHRATPGDSRITPVDTDSSEVEWSSWPHGEHVEITALGSVSTILHLCDLTENERESVMLAARKLSGDDNVVFAAARGLSSDTQPQAGTLTFDGLASYAIQVYPGTVDSIAQLRDAGKRIVYMTSEPEDIAASIGQVCGIADKPSHSVHHAHFAPSIPHSIYAFVDRHNARRVLDSLPQPVLVSQHRVSELAQMITSFL